MSILEETHIEERAVTIKVLRIGSRQMTQTLFWQFPGKEIIDANDGTLHGHVWGRVRIENKSGDVLHILWEHENTLYRSSLKSLELTRKKRQSELERFIEQDATCLLMAEALEGRKWRNTKTGSSIGIDYVSPKIGDTTIRDIEVTPNIKTLWTYDEQMKKLEQDKEKLTEQGNQLPLSAKYYESQVEDKQKKIDESTKRYNLARQETIQNLLKWLSIDTLPASLAHIVESKIINTSIAKLEAYNKQWETSHQMLIETEQLFIGA